MIESDALLVRAAPYGEADVMATLFTEQIGLVTCSARGARRSSKRFGGLESIHTLRLSFDPKPSAEVGILFDASIIRSRIRVTSSLGRMDAASRGLGWLRKVAQPHNPEPRAWMVTNAFLDALAGQHAIPSLLLVTYGLHLLTAMGWGLDLAACVKCGKPCPSGAAACVSPRDGGCVCQECGGAPLFVGGALRKRVALTLSGESALLPTDVPMVTRLVERTLALVVGVEG